MYLNISYGWHTAENRAETQELEDALKECVVKFGFEQTETRNILKTGRRTLMFTDEEFVRAKICQKAR